MLDGFINVVILLAILVGLVVIHELGHFIVARRAGVRVHEFGIGFPPRARIFARDRETIYTLNWLPIGGFVRLEGEEGESDDPRAFVRQPLGTRLAILLAGVVMNFIVAILIFTVIAGLSDPITHVRIGGVQAGSPAAQAGLVGGAQTGTDAEGRPLFDDSGDRIVAIDGIRFAVFDRIDQPDAPLRYLRERAGQTVQLTVLGRDGVERTVSATLRPPEQAAEQGALGIVVQGFPRQEIQRDPVTALQLGLSRTVDASTLILRGLRDFVTDLTNPQISGPVGIVTAVGQVRADLPPVYFVWLIGLLSANLAIVNVLPFPPMDGGRIAVALLQAATGNRISVAAERAVYLAGFVLLMALLVWVTFFDVGLLERRT